MNGQLLAGWKEIQHGDKPAEFHIEKGTIWIFPCYNIDTLATELSKQTPNVWDAITRWQVSVNGRYGGHFVKLDEAMESGQKSVEAAMKKQAKSR